MLFPRSTKPPRLRWFCPCGACGVVKWGRDAAKRIAAAHRRKAPACADDRVRVANHYRTSPAGRQGGGDG